jgi:hypothetical protein
LVTDAKIGSQKYRRRVDRAAFSRRWKTEPKGFPENGPRDSEFFHSIVWFSRLGGPLPRHIGPHSGLAANPVKMIRQPQGSFVLPNFSRARKQRQFVGNSRKKTEFPNESVA